jgi:DUF1365 family protein
MSHQFFDGTIYHQRFAPKKHQFTYPFFMVDIDIEQLNELNVTRFFSYNSFNLFSFYSKDHFGTHQDFLENIHTLLNHFSLPKASKMRFITLPRIAGFVFNPISVLVLFEQDTPTHLIAEVHNYNGGRVIYPVKLHSSKGNTYTGKTQKDMYVSPFFKREGEYEFTLMYTQKQLLLNIVLFENNQKMLTSSLKANALVFNQKSVLTLFFKHTFLTMWVVTRTIYQTIKLKLKGLTWTTPIKEDQIRRL